jgi:hypothetical protein
MRLGVWRVVPVAFERYFEPGMVVAGPNQDWGFQDWVAVAENSIYFFVGIHFEENSGACGVCTFGRSVPLADVSIDWVVETGYSKTVQTQPVGCTRSWTVDMVAVGP